mmetsp:Transcript_15826/g.48360  ORF Transcript_15826/g.48360 Transcript_15826/m.48360 type:complete len:214 (-) Transcript_15826:395-1036(-)
MEPRTARARQRRGLTPWRRQSPERLTSRPQCGTRRSTRAVRVCWRRAGCPRRGAPRRMPCLRPRAALGSISWRVSLGAATDGLRAPWVRRASTRHPQTWRRVLQAALAPWPRSTAPCPMVSTGALQLLSRPTIGITTITPSPILSTARGATRRARSRCARNRASQTTPLMMAKRRTSPPQSATRRHHRPRRTTAATILTMAWRRRHSPHFPVG